MRGGRPNSGEAAVVGGADVFGCFPPAEQPLPGGACVAGGRTPAKPQWSEVMIFLDDFLRQRALCPEERSCRRRVLCQLAQFRRANVSRRTLIYRRPYSGEAAMVGGDNLFGRFPPAEKPLTGGEPLLEKSVVPANSVPARDCSPEDIDFPAAKLRRSHDGRR